MVAGIFGEVGNRGVKENLMGLQENHVNNKHTLRRLNMLNKDSKYSLSDIISYMKITDSRNDDFCLYGELDERLNANGNYYIADYPDVDYNDKEIYPEIVTNKKLHYLYSGEQFADVIDSVVEQKPSATLDDFVKALNFYSENDNFLDF